MAYSNNALENLKRNDVTITNIERPKINFFKDQQLFSSLFINELVKQKSLLKQ